MLRVHSNHEQHLVKSTWALYARISFNGREIKSITVGISDNIELGASTLQHIYYNFRDNHDIFFNKNVLIR